MSLRYAQTYLVPQWRLTYSKAGDYNSIPTTLPMTIIRDYASLSDSWAVIHPNNEPSPSRSQAVSPAMEAIRRYGITADSPLNTYSAGKQLDPTAREQHGKRLDYILYRQPHSHRPNVESPVIRAKEAQVVFTDSIPGRGHSYSDHFGLEVTFEIVHPVTTPSEMTPPNPTTTLSSEAVTTTIQALTTAYRISRLRSRRELAVFCLSIFVLLALIISSAWLKPHWINVLFSLLTVFFSWLATTNLYEGFLYGNWERNALMNVIEELEIYRDVSGGGTQARS
jgi:sphingomyelin phosphodiesterase 2